MAIIIPYADGNAHGSLAGSVSFRRRYGKVVFQKKPYPKQPNTPAQIVQRTKFKAALSGWYALNQYTKDFYNTRGPQLGMTGQNLYIKQSLLNNLPSITPWTIKQFTDMNIINTRSLHINGVRWEFKDTPWVQWIGRVWDNENIEYSGWSYPAGVTVKMSLSYNNAPGAVYQFRDGIWLKYDTTTSTNLEIIIRVPAVDVTSGTKVFYIADDGSIYWDSAMTQLACVSKF